MRPVPFFTTAILLLTASLRAGELLPLMTIPDQVLFQSDFTATAPLDKSIFAAKQGTRWSITNGVLLGLPSTPEYQAKKKDHKGTEARLSFVNCPEAFALRFSFRFTGGAFTAATPMIELGHHVTRVQWTTNGIRLLAKHDGLQIAQDTSFKLQTNQWYQALAEVKGDAVLFQFAEGPTLYGKHESIATNNHHFGIAGMRGGTVELDDLTLWSIKDGAPEFWDRLRASLPPQKEEPVAAKKR
jgi:hypothetical protein